MTIDDSTLLAQAVSSTTKRVKRSVHGSIGHVELYACYVAWNVGLAFLEWKGVIPATTNAPLTADGGAKSSHLAAYFNNPLISYIIETILHPSSFWLHTFIYPVLISASLKVRPGATAIASNTIPSRAGTAIAAAISVLSAICSTPEHGLTAELVLILAADLCQLDRTLKLASAFWTLDLPYFPWVAFAQGLAVVHHQPESTAETGQADGKSNLLLKDASIDNVGPTLTDSVHRLSAIWRESTARDVALICLAMGLGLARFLPGISRTDVHAGGSLRMAGASLTTQFLLSTLVFLPTLLESGLDGSIRGAVRAGLGSPSALARSAATLGLIVYLVAKQDQGLAQATTVQLAIASSSLLVCSWLWYNRLRSSITLIYALSLTTTALLSSTLAKAAGYPHVDLIIPLLLLRLQLAKLPPSPRPAHEAEEERKKPDPQKGLTPYEERDVDLILEAGWYMLLGTAWRFWPTTA